MHTPVLGAQPCRTRYGVSVRVSLPLRSPTRPIDVNDGQRVRGAIWVQNHGGLVRVLTQMQLEAVAIFRGVIAVGAPILVYVGVRLHVRVQHGLVDASVAATGAFERLRAEVVAQVVLQMVLVLGHERALGAVEHLLGLDVRLGVTPKVLLGHGHELALLAFEDLDLALRVDFWHPNALVVVQVLWRQVVLLPQVGLVFWLGLGAVLAFGAPTTRIENMRN